MPMEQLCTTMNGVVPIVVLHLRDWNIMLRTAAILLAFFASTLMAADCPTGFANFGDELTDTGNGVTLFPFELDCENSPYGETFFGNPAKRFSNGRLVPDFFSLAFRKPLLDPFFKSTSYNYDFGINFAEAGATGDPILFTLIRPKNPFSVYPYQVNQFRRFFNSVVATESKPACANFDASLPFPFGTSWVSKWLYTITAGFNDLSLGITDQAFNPNFLGFAQANVIPNADYIVLTLRTLYAIGARNFLVFGVPALGCSPRFLTLFPPSSLYPRDNLGCISSINNLTQAFNAEILRAIRIQKQQFLPGASVAFFDYYAAHIQIISNPATFGFTETFKTCCGAPGLGTLNYNPNILCGRFGSNNCANPDQYVNWDGAHYTDAFYKMISIFALNGVFTDSPVNYAAKCALDFSRFPSVFTFNQVYPFVCQTIFV